MTSYSILIPSMIVDSVTLPLLSGSWLKGSLVKLSNGNHHSPGTAKRPKVPFDSKGPLAVQHGPKLLPWLRAIEHMEEEQQRLRKLPVASLTPKTMNESYYSVKLAFSTDEVPDFRDIYLN